MLTSYFEIYLNNEVGALTLKLESKIYWSLSWYAPLPTKGIFIDIIFVQLGFSMKLTHLSSVQYWFIHGYRWAYIHRGLEGSHGN